MNERGKHPLGVAGGLTRASINSALTPHFILAALAPGLVALVSLPRKEEPQISVPLVDIHVQAQGLKAKDAVKLVTEPLEIIVKRINDVEHVYSSTRDDAAMVTARFRVGTRSEDAILRMHDKVRANNGAIPVGIPEPLIVGRGIDDVAILTLTLSAGDLSANDLTRIACTLQTEVAKTQDVGLSYLVGDAQDAIRIEPDPDRLALHGVTLQQLGGKVDQANRTLNTGRLRGQGQMVDLVAGETLTAPAEVANLLLTTRDGRPVYVSDVATVRNVENTRDAIVSHLAKFNDGTATGGPAVTLAIAKRAGANAVVVAEEVLHRVHALQERLIPEGVTIKLLPFDNKSELGVVIDLPEGASVEATDRVARDVADVVMELPEVTSVQTYVGTPAPFNFNGLVRHYCLRQEPHLGEVAINLTPKADRDRASHDIALDLRERLATLAVPEGASLKVVEPPPGQPVISTLLAEVYGPDAKTRREAATLIRKAFQAVPFIVDVDDSFGTQARRLRATISTDDLDFFGVQEQDVFDTLALLNGGQTVGYSHRGDGRLPIPLVMGRDTSDRVQDERFLTTPIPANALPGARDVVELGDVIRVKEEAASFPIFRHNGRAAEMVTAELAGAFEAPLYGMLAVADKIGKMDWPEGTRPEISLHGQPEDEGKVTLLRDGEWEVTFVTFRDMGAAFGIALLGIYILVVAQFGSFKLPLVIPSRRTAIDWFWLNASFDLWREEMRSTPGIPIACARPERDAIRVILRIEWVGSGTQDKALIASVRRAVQRTRDRATHKGRRPFRPCRKNLA